MSHGDSSASCVPGRQGVILSTSEPLTWESDSTYDEVAVKIPREAIERTFLSLTGREAPRPIELPLALDLSSWTGRFVEQQLSALFCYLRSGPGALPPRAVLSTVEDGILRSLLLGLPHSSAADIQRDPREASASAVKRAEAYIEAHADDPLTASQVASAAGVSIRSLQRTFRRHRAYSPMVFLRRLRLQRAHERLQAAGRKASVTEIALSSGFGHLGEFSVAYRKRFGETPTETLHKR